MKPYLGPQNFRRWLEGWDFEVELSEVSGLPARSLKPWRRVIKFPTLLRHFPTPYSNFPTSNLSPRTFDRPKCLVRKAVIAVRMLGRPSVNRNCSRRHHPSVIMHLSSANQLFGSSQILHANSNFRHGTFRSPSPSSYYTSRHHFLLSLHLQFSHVPLICGFCLFFLFILRLSGTFKSTSLSHSSARKVWKS